MLFSMTNELIWQAEVSLLLSEKDINYKKTAPTRKCVGASCFYRVRIVVEVEKIINFTGNLRILNRFSFTEKFHCSLFASIIVSGVFISWLASVMNRFCFS